VLVARLGGYARIAYRVSFDHLGLAAAGIAALAGCASRRNASLAPQRSYLLLGFASSSTYGTKARAAVEAGDPTMLQNATTNLQQANDHMAKVNNLLQVELAIGT
jgi:hypothetical protein